MPWSIPAELPFTIYSSRLGFDNALPKILSADSWSLTGLGKGVIGYHGIRKNLFLKTL